MKVQGYICQLNKKEFLTTSSILSTGVVLGVGVLSSDTKNNKNQKVQ
ncbi:hypothetical protein MNB_ARC-1_543 [hydrothermal vent metagenome]|uniref:Uncharacterized protein n=1 Tax=hydrothermal vent metagenome TaxID=652676 RepID=A0A3B1DTM9_9ZZZZ